jgi:hypothetical protein
MHEGNGGWYVRSSHGLSGIVMVLVSAGITNQIKGLITALNNYKIKV